MTLHEVEAKLVIKNAEFDRAYDSEGMTPTTEKILMELRELLRLRRRLRGEARNRGQH